MAFDTNDHNRMCNLERSLALPGQSVYSRWFLLHFAALAEELYPEGTIVCIRFGALAGRFVRNASWSCFVSCSGSEPSTPSVGRRRTLESRTFCSTSSDCCFGLLVLYSGAAKLSETRLNQL